MIGKLTGTIDSIHNNQAILDVNGVGYLVHASGTTLQHCQPGAVVTLWIETHVREDHIHLYGFASTEEKAWFNTLTGVNGVGPKMGLAILSVLNPAAITTALLSADNAAFTQVSGVGAKLAARLITELKDKTDTVLASVSASDFPAAHAGETASSDEDTETRDAISALTSLGYRRSDAYLAVQKLRANNADASMEDLIKLGLKELTA